MRYHSASMPTERTTRQRLAVRRTLETAGTPLRAQEVLVGAAEAVPGIGLATVYRALKAMIESGDVVTVALPGDTPRYELSHDEHHHHFSCRGCGQVFEVDGCPGDLSTLAPEGFAVEAHEVVLYGRCAGCLS